MQSSKCNQVLRRDDLVNTGSTVRRRNMPHFLSGLPSAMNNDTNSRIFCWSKREIAAEIMQKSPYMSPSCLLFALETYLERIIDFDPMSFDNKHQLQDWILSLLVLLGGDAQVMLDFFDFTAKIDPVEPGEHGLPVPPDTPVSKASQQYPLLALHGFFEADTRTSFLVSALYLLACYRSFAKHILLKISFQAFQTTTANSFSILPELPEGVQDLIASFLWGAHNFTYGEHLPAEMQRTAAHIKDRKEHGSLFLDGFREEKWPRSTISHFMTSGIFRCKKLPHTLFVLYRKEFAFWSAACPALCISNLLPLEEIAVTNKSKEA